MGMNLSTITNTEFKKLFVYITAIWFLAFVFLLTIGNTDEKLLISVAILSYILLISALYNILNNHYKKIRNLTLKIEQISRGSFRGLVENQRESDIDVLEFQIYQMSKRIQANLEQADQDKTLARGTISGLSHQFKTPITVLRTFNDLLLEGAIEDKAVAVEFLEKSSVQLDKLERLVQMFLKLSKIETGVNLINKSDNDINAIILDIISALREKAGKKQQSITFEKSDDIIFVFCDAEWIFEAIYNIVDNSIEYTPHGGIIGIFVSRTETHVKIEIEDNGIGIGDEDISRVFETFYQAESAKKQNNHSTGIGLALTKLIVDKHAGIVRIDSSLGSGTKAAVILPL